MKILAVNSSPRSNLGSITELLLNNLVEGMQEAGAEVCTVNLSEKTIKPCLGCFNCWTKTPGRCIQMDDMTHELLPKVSDVDLLVYATPLYFKTMNAAMSIFRERMLPLSLPFMEKRDGKRSFLLRQKLPPVVWLSVCALPELSEFDAFSLFLDSTCHPDIPIVAKIYRTSSEALRHPVFKEKLSDILNATLQAGEELVRSLEISPDTMARIRQPLVDSELLATLGNLSFKTCIAEKLTLKEFFEKGMTLRPDSLKAFMAYSTLRLNAEVAAGKKVILQFEFSGEIQASCYFTFEGGNIEATAGTSHTYDIAIETPFELWMDIMTGKVEGREMFIQGRYKVEGDLSLMLELFKQEGS
ncbi:MAG: NAD(P)H-dependent oxidoreductase [Deltaproteobacteria bacterium]|jgi:putative sterol carrier protein